jgi:hypothetical protein
MIMKKIAFLLILFCLQPFLSFSQVDKTFWFAAPEVTTGHGDTPIVLRLAAFTAPSVVTISMPANPAFVPIVVNMPANSVATRDLTAFLAQIETPFDAGGATPTPRTTGILVESTASITAYYEVNRTNNPEIFALKGVNALGADFYLPLQTAWNAQTALVPETRTGFVVVATVDNTVVTITPSKTLEGGRTAGVPYTITLNRGQSYCGSVLAPSAGNSPTGTRITSDKPIAVTMFDDSIRSGAGGCYDLAGDQLIPTNLLGTQYSVQRSFLNNDEQIVIVATQNGTTITVTNSATTVINLNAGQSATVMLADIAPNYTFLASNLPIYVAHYGGFGCEVGSAILPPLNCTGSRNVRFIRSTDEYCGITLLTKTGNQDKFSFNGGAVNTDIPASAFTVVPGSGGVWQSARIEITLAQLAAAATGLVNNSGGLFHLGLINGGSSTGSRYGYFSNFNALNLGPDITISYGTSVTLDAGPDGFSYLWNTGATTQTINVPIFLQGSYIVTVDIGNGCLLSDTVCVGTVEYVWTGFKDSNYNDPDNWSRPCGVVGLPNCNVDVVVPIVANLKGAKATMNITGTDACRDLWIEESGGDKGTLRISSGGRFNVCRNFRHEGILDMQANSTLAFTGNVPQSYSFKSSTAVGEFENVIINNTTTPISNTQWAKVTIKDGATFGNMTISSTGSLTFQSGYLETENLKEVVVKNRATNAITGHSLNKYVVGRLRRYTNATGSYDFPVGLAINTAGSGVVDATKTGTLTNMDSATDWVNANYCTGIGNTKVLDFDGTDDFVQMPVFTQLSGNQPRTIEMWANVRSFAGVGGLFHFGNTNTLQDFSLRVNGSTNNWRAQFWGSDYDFNTSALNAGAGLLNTWHHYAMTYNGTQICIYIDGTLVNTCQTFNLNTSLVNNYLARWSWGYLNGQIDEVRIWNYAKPVSEISTNLCKPITQCATAGLIAYYDFEEGTGTSITHKDLVCIAPTMSYQLANVDFYTPASQDNLLAFFNAYSTIPSLSGQPLHCGADFNCQVLNNGFWTINAFNATNTQITGTGNYTMTLYNRDYTNAAAACVTGIGDKGAIMKRNTGVTTWALASGFCSNQSFNSTAKTNMSGFSDFATARTFMPVLLPVEIANFQANYKGKNTVQIIWETITEKNVAYFVVEKSNEGTNFVQIDTKNAEGNSTYRKNYTGFDYQANKGINYYRLKTVDIDGKISYSKIVAINAEEGKIEKENFNIYPNPTPKGNEISLTNLPKENTEIKIITATGQIVFQSNKAENQTSMQIATNTFASGLYLVQIITENGEISSQKLLIQ